MANLKEMFPNIDNEVIKMVVKSNDGRIDSTIDQLLIINSECKEENNSCRSNGSNKPIYFPNLPENMKQFGSLTDSEEDSKDECAICLEFLNREADTPESNSETNERHQTFAFEIAACKHVFHVECVQRLLKIQGDDDYLECPLCKTISGAKTGTQPVTGTMSVHKEYEKIPGFEQNSQGMIIVTYDFTGGIQGPEHPNPGQHYFATSFPRITYFPDNEQGRKIVEMIKIAFQRRLVFTVGRSVTTGEDNVITWNEIHHKTSIESGTYGYPDSNYLHNTERELKAFGITEKDIQHQEN